MDIGQISAQNAQDFYFYKYLLVVTGIILVHYNFVCDNVAILEVTGVKVTAS